MNETEEAVSRAQWLKMIGAVESCAEKMDALMSTYGMLTFGVALTIFYENLPGNVMMQVERLKYINTKLRNQGLGKIKGYLKKVDGVTPFTQDEYNEKNIIPKGDEDAHPDKNKDS